MKRLRLISGQELNSSQQKIVLLCFLCSLTFVIAIVSGPHGHLITDEGTYHLMARSFAESGSLAVWNGYEEFPSPELVVRHSIVYAGRLVPQYPYLFAVLSYPLYWLAGYEGLIYLNSIAFVATVGLCFLIARKLFQDTGLALNACLILILATYAWEYSQGAWPHALSMLFVIGSVYFAATALVAEDARKAALLVLAGGIVAGFGVGIRLDVIFVLPALVVPFIFLRPWRPWCALAACLGTVPGLAVLAATNYAKFGVVSPFSYAPAAQSSALRPESYVPIVLLGLAVLAAVWVMSRPRGRELLRANRRVVAAGMVVLGGLVVLSPALWGLVSRLADGVYQLLVDLRIRDLDYGHGGLSRGPGGSLVYLNTVKKALLQSCPYLVMLVVPMTMLARGAKDSMALGVLLLTPVAFIAAYAYYAWDGGLSFNLRYFVPILPFTSILAAFAWREITYNMRGFRARLPIVVGGTAGMFLAVVIIIGPTLMWDALTIEHQEVVFLTLPLVIAIVCFALVLVQMFRLIEVVRWVSTAALTVALVWSGMVAFSNDFPRSNAWRKERANLSEILARFIQKDSIVFAENPHIFYGVPDDRRLRIALPLLDNFEDFHRLVEFNLDRDRAVYVWVTEVMENEVSERQLFDPFIVLPLHEHRWGTFVQLIGPTERHVRKTPVRQVFNTAAHSFVMIRRPSRRMLASIPLRKSRTMATGAARRRAHNRHRNRQRPGSGLTTPYPSG